MAKIFVLSDDGVSSGYGRISTETNRRMMLRGHEVLAASIQYDGLLPPQYDGERIPYHVASLGGRANWPDLVVNLINVYQPDAVWVVQDAPFAQTVRNAPLDWSKYAFLMTTPIDGSPIFPAWIETAKIADALLTISEFGVQAWKEAGISAHLCRPGINPNKFYKLTDEQRLALRKQAGIESDAFVMGVMCQNQGRKSIPQMMWSFFKFAQDKPTARLILDMDATSPAGWDLIALCEQFGWNRKQVLFRHELQRAGIMELRDRYNLLDAHSVLAFREGFGLPILEAMACGVVSIAQDWCAGTEVLRNDRGILIPPIDYFTPSTWGGALDKLPNLHVLVEKLEWLYNNPSERSAMAKRGMEWARQQTWDIAVDNCLNALEKALANKRKPAAVPVQPPPVVTAPANPVISPDGVNVPDKVIALVD